MPKFLIIRFSSIGDIVLTTPVIRCLKLQVPGAEVHFFTKPAFANVLEHNPHIDQLHLLEGSLLKKTLALKQTGFDYIIDLHHNLRTLIIKSIINVPSFSFEKLNFEKSVLVYTKQNMLPDLHIVDRYLDTLKNFGVKNDGKGLDYFLPENHGFTIPAGLPAKYAAFAIGAQHGTKRLPVEKIIAICKDIKLPVVLLGGKNDAGEGKLVAASGEHIMNLCGELSLHQSSLVIKHAAKVISHDTGLMHIAAAFKKPVISIWGNTVPQFGMTPYYGADHVENTISEVKGLSCRPCSKIGFKQCPLGHFNCMNFQDTAAISSEINRI